MINRSTITYHNMDDPKKHNDDSKESCSHNSTYCMILYM